MMRPLLWDPGQIGAVFGGPGMEFLLGLLAGLIGAWSLCAQRRSKTGKSSRNTKGQKGRGGLAVNENDIQITEETQESNEEGKGEDAGTSLRSDSQPFVSRAFAKLFGSKEKTKNSERKDPSDQTVTVEPAQEGPTQRLGKVTSAEFTVPLGSDYNPDNPQMLSGSAFDVGEDHIAKRPYHVVVADQAKNIQELLEVKKQEQLIEEKSKLSVQEGFSLSYAPVQEPPMSEHAPTWSEPSTQEAPADKNLPEHLPRISAKLSSDSIAPAAQRIAVPINLASDLATQSTRSEGNEEWKLKSERAEVPTTGEGGEKKDSLYLLHPHEGEILTVPRLVRSDTIGAS